MENPKVIVVGLDGGTWDLIETWTDMGDLPTFKRLLREGVHGKLKTIIPPVTAPAWTSFATGKNPGKHGIFDFVKIERNNMRMVSARDLRCDTLHDILSREGFRNIIIGLPLSFPPKDNFNGIIISDFLYPRKDIEPKEKSRYLDDYRVWPYSRAIKSKEELLNEMLRTAGSRIKTTKELIVNEKWDFLFLHYGETDWISHKFWMDIKNNTKLGRKAKHIFEIADEFLDWLMRWMNKKGYLFVISDHGFGDCPFKININRIFIREGLLRVCFKTVDFASLYPNLYKSEKVSESPSARHRLAKFILRFVNHIGANNDTLYRQIFRPLLACGARFLFPKNSHKVKRREENRTIDFENSKVFTPNNESFSIYVNEPNLAERRKLVESVIETLERMEYRGNKVFKRIWGREKIYSGSYVNEAPDIMAITNGFFISNSLDGHLFETYAEGGQHDLNGIFLAHGPSIKKGIETRNAGICDIAPTVLHIFGLPIPNDMDGHVLVETFEDNSELRRRRPVYVRPACYDKFIEQTSDLKGQERIKDRLRKLGYL